MSLTGATRHEMSVTSRDLNRECKSFSTATFEQLGCFWGALTFDVLCVPVVVCMHCVKQRRCARNSKIVTCCWSEGHGKLR